MSRTAVGRLAANLMFKGKGRTPRREAVRGASSELPGLRMRREFILLFWIENGKGLSGLILEALRSRRNEIDPTRYSASS